MDEDREIQAISKVNAALKDLSDDERFRVIQWLADKYVQMGPLKLATKVEDNSREGIIEDGVEDEDQGQDGSSKNYDTFAEMLDTSGASKETERFLVAAYWLQVKSGEQTWKSFQINKLLKDTGNRIATITTPTRYLSNTKPALIVQVAKNATSKGKGAKVLKLTTEGIKKVEQMLGGK